MHPALTDRQQTVLDAISAHQRAHGAPPTLSELALRLGVHVNAARKHVAALAARGALSVHPGQARGIRLADAGRAAAPFSLPILGRVAAGVPIESHPELEGEFAIDPGAFSPRPDYLLRVRGDSMREDGILDGDLIAVRQSPEALHGQTVVARIDGALTVKRLELKSGRIRLLPRNPEYAPIEVHPEQDFAIEGRYCGLVRRA